MTNRSDFVWLDAEKDVHDLWEQALHSSHSHFPVARGSLENVIGVISFKSLSEVVQKKPAEGIESAINEPLKIPTHLDALKVLDLFRESKEQIAFVLDEHGNVDGVLTLHDLLEAMVGSIDLDGEQLWIKRADNSYLVDAAINLVDLFELLELEESIKEVAPGYHSLGGLICHQLGKIPREGELMNFSGFTFEVVDMDGTRIDKVLISSP